MEEKNDNVIQFPTEEEENMEYTELHDLFGNIPGMEGMDILATVLSLSDNDFEPLKPILLEEMEKGFNNSNDKYNLAFALNESGMTIPELEETFQKVIKAIDNMENISETKKDFVRQMFGMLVNSMATAKALRHRIIRIPIELCHPDAKIPTYAHDGDAGCDVYALDDYTLEPYSTTIIPTGLKVAIPAGYELQVRPRSGMSAKTKVRIANAPGTIDSGYRDEIGIIFDNISDRPFYITKRQRIAQLVLQEVPTASFYEIKNVSAIGENRLGGFGSTDNT